MMTTASGRPIKRPDSLGEVIQRVAMLGEDDELAAMPVGVEHLGVVLEKLRKLVPFAVGAGLPDAKRGSHQSRQLVDLGAKLGDGAGGGRLIDDLLFGVFELGVRCVVEVVDVVGRKCRQAGIQVEADFGSALQQLLLAKPLFQAFAAALQGLVDRFGRRCQAALQDGEREADGSLPAFVFKGLGPVEFLADVVGDFLVEFGFSVRKGVVDRVGRPLREERRAVELEQLFLDQAAHHVAGVGNVNAVAELALEAVAVEQGHEELEVRLLAVVRRGGQQQEVPGQRREQLAEPVALGVLDLVAEIGRAQLVGFVADDQVPVGLLELGLGIFVPAQLVEPADGQGDFVEPVSGSGRLQGVIGHDLERQVELAVEFVLPLLDEVAGADDQAALKVAAGDQLADEQAGHDRLAGPRIVRQQEPKRLAGKHLAVDGGDLVRQRLDERSVDGKQRIKQVGQPDAVRFGKQAEQRAVAVEAPGPARLHDFERRLAVAVEQFVAESSRACPCR